MKFLIPLLSLALAVTGFALEEGENPFSEADEATYQSVRIFFKQYQQLYNDHEAHALASFFGDGGVMHPPDEEYIGRTAIEKHINDSDFGHWHVKNEVITVNEVKTLGDLVVAVGNWSNTVQEKGGPPINLQGWWNACMQQDDKGEWAISMNNYGIQE